MNNPDNELHSEDKNEILLANVSVATPVETEFKFKEFVKAAVLAMAVALIIKTLFFEAYKIPTGSMERTLLPGDFIIVNKSAYKISTPSNIPFTDLEIPSINLFPMGEPELNDVIVFKFPGNKDELFPSTNVNYIKRVIGLPGDTVQILNGEVFRRGEKILPPPEGKPNKVITLERNKTQDRIYPAGANWSKDNYGPLVIPQKGMTVSLSSKNINQWKTLIDREFGMRAVSEEGTVIMIDNKPARSYTFSRNYYFVLGDNRDDSMDSRYWGFVPDDALIGEAIMVYWSWDVYSVSGFWEIFNSIRFNRIFKIIH